MQRPTGWSLVALVLCASCVDEPSETTEQFELCGDPEAYTPYGTGTHPIGSVTALPWRGDGAMYPAGVEDFRGYGLETVECGSNKALRSHVDVTAGCLKVVSDTHGEIESTSAGAFRTLALGYAAGSTLPIKWTDQSIEYRFKYAATSGAGVLPGFKAFARYRSEDDLYVASWRMDGVVQIQKKQCGEYTALKILHAYGAPSPNAWHHMRFTAVGDQLELFLDGAKVISISDATFAWGTAGIRTDAMTGALIDDWRVGTVGGLPSRERAEHERAHVLAR
jgi:hypothetical protein